MFRGLQNFFIALLVVVSGPHRSLAGDAVPGGYFSQFEETRKKLTEKGTPFGEEVSEPDPSSKFVKIGELEPSPLRSAASCGKVDLRGRLGEVRDQGGSDWCYGYVMADLLSFYSGVRISALDLSLRTFSQIKTQRFKALREKAREENLSILDFQSGRTYQAFQIAKREGVCEEARAKSSDFIASEVQKRMGLPLNVGEPGETLLAIDHMIQEVESWNTKGGVLSMSGESACRAGAHAQGIFETLSLPEVLAALEQAPSRHEAFGWLSQLSCEGKRIPISKDLTYRMTYLPKSAEGQGKGDRLLPSLDSILDSGNPATMQLSMSRLLKGSSGDGAHVALIVGREYRNGACQYLLRNSWGPSCRGYARPCERGNVWITEEDIRSSALYVGGMEGPAENSSSR